MNTNATPSPAPRYLLICAIIALLLLALGPLGTRENLFHFRTGLLVTVAAFALGAISMVAADIMLLFPRFRGQRLKLALISGLGLIPTAVAVVVLGSSSGLPMIHDISTDTQDPPAFRAALALRGDDSNPLQRSAEVDSLQREAYADIEPLMTSKSPAEAFERAIAVSKELGWVVHNTEQASGIIEATYTSAWFGFVDDIVIRIRPHMSGNTQIDLRSVSRVGKGDLGANAKRIRAFIQRFNTG